MASGKSASQSGQTAFGERLLARFSEGAAARGSNLIFSPLSIHVALALMSAGASGDTLDEILAVASAPSREELTAFVARAMVRHVLADCSDVGGPCVVFTCGVWTDCRCPLKPQYRDTIVESFKGEASTVDFVDQPVESRQQINAWVAEATRGLITELMNPHEQSKTTANVVVNAIYFKGEWSNPFNRDNTVDGEFHRLDGSSVAVPFMRSWSDQRIACHDGFKVLELPYKVMDKTLPGFSWEQWRSTPRFFMCVFLPDADDGLPGLVEKMALTSSPEAESGEFLHGHLPATPVPVGKFLFPRFKLSFGAGAEPGLRYRGGRPDETSGANKI